MMFRISHAHDCIGCSAVHDIPVRCLASSDFYLLASLRPIMGIVEPTLGTGPING